MNISFKVWNRVICVVPAHNTLTYDNIYFQKLRYAFTIGYIIIHNPTKQKHELCNDTRTWYNPSYFVCIRTLYKNYVYILQNLE